MKYVWTRGLEQDGLLNDTLAAAGERRFNADTLACIRLAGHQNVELHVWHSLYALQAPENDYPLTKRKFSRSGSAKAHEEDDIVEEFAKLLNDFVSRPGSFSVLSLCFSIFAADWCV